MALVIPKCNADKETLKLTLKLYYDADEWVSNAKLIDELSQALIKAGIEDVKKEPQSYTKKTQVLSYYGLIEWEDPMNSQSNRRITQEGKQMYQLLEASDKKGVQELLISIMQSHTFGRNVLGCNSDSDLEPPCIFVKSVLIMGYLTMLEFAYILGRMEFDHKEYGDALFDVLLKREAGVPITLDAKTSKWADPKPILALVHWEILVKGQNGYILDEDLVSNYYEGLSNLRTKNTDSPKSWSLSGSSQALIQDKSQDIPSKYRPFVAAIKTKSFLLLAGISGTGKSKIVREMARACWPGDNPNSKAQEPDNFMMIQVRPNWHDSTELIGYVSNIPEPHYVAGPFLRAIVKAWELTEEYSEDGKTMPYFVCLDEMNLAPVEQYFAEYLSVIESRTGSGKDITTDVILKEAEDWYFRLTAKLTDSDNDKVNENLRKRFNTDGISLPPNLIVCGTVNMDETTFSFSRKVLDRAMTIEMNDVVLKAGLGEAEESFPPIKPESLLADRIRPEDYYDAGECMETIDAVLGWLGKINEKLEGTPFKIAYRTRNEILLYVIHSEELGVGREEAFDEAVNMKILPRIEGDQKKVENVLTDLIDVLKKDVGIEEEDSSPSLAKLTLMDDRLKKQYYCTYWN